MSQPDDRTLGELAQFENDHILVKYPKLTIKHSNVVIFEAYLTPLDVVYLCENGVQKLVIDYLKRYHKINSFEEVAPTSDTVANYDDHGPSFTEGNYQETYIMLKPDALPRKMVGTVISKF